jgi:hypothetical protein
MLDFTLSYSISGVFMVLVFFAGCGFLAAPSPFKTNDSEKGRKLDVSPGSECLEGIWTAKNRQPDSSGCLRANLAV